MKSQCAYCGAEDPATRDHIPPKCVFLRPFPRVMITVPSCEKCQGLAKDDEYFAYDVVNAANGMVTNGLLQLSTCSKQLLERKQDELLDRLGTKFRGGHGGLARKLLSELTEVPVITRGNLLIPDRTLLISTPETDRINRVADRIIRGLFFYEKGYKVPENYSVQAEISQIGIDSDRVEFFEERYKHPMTNMRIVQEGVFAYGYWGCSDDKDASVWLGDFYNVPLLSGMIAPQQ